MRHPHSSLLTQHPAQLTAQPQAWIESLFGHLKYDWPHRTRVTDAAASAPNSTTPNG